MGPKRSHRGTELQFQLFWLYMYRYMGVLAVVAFEQVLPGGSRRGQMLSDYTEVRRRLGDSNAPDRTASLMYGLLKK